MRWGGLEYRDARAKTRRHNSLTGSTVHGNLDLNPFIRGLNDAETGSLLGYQSADPAGLVHSL